MRPRTVNATIAALTALSLSTAAIGQETTGDPQPAPGGGTGPVVMLIHGGLLPASIWDGQFREWSSRYRVLKVDRQGGGRSSGPRETAEIGEVFASLDGFGMSSAAVVCFSSGCGLALDVAITFPERVDRLILVSPLGRGMRTSAHYLERTLGNLQPLYPGGDAAGSIERWVEDPWLTSGPGPARDLVAEGLGEFPGNLRTPFEEVQSTDPAAVDRLSELDLPVLVVVGADDAPDVHAHAGVLEHLIGGARRVVLPGGHLVHVESPELFDAEVHAFLATAEEAAQQMLAAVEERPIEELRALFAYDPRAPLEVEEHDIETRDGGVRLVDLTFASPVSGRVTAYLTLPPGPGPHPAALFLHPGQGDRSTFVDEMVELAGHGLAGLSVDAPQVRPQPWTRSDSFFAAEQSHEIAVQTVVDLQRSLDLLVARPEVDGDRLAVVGQGLGATFGGVLVGVEDRLSGAVLASGQPAASQVWTRGDHLMQVAFRTLLEPAQQEAYLALHRDLDAAHYLPHAAPARLLLQYPEGDDRVTRADALAFQAVAPEATELRWYATLGDQARADRQQWLLGLLGLDEAPER
jgi:pimeloyl-ACP methyl ester carboxylesterase